MCTCAAHLYTPIHAMAVLGDGGEVGVDKMELLLLVRWSARCKPEASSRIITITDSVRNSVGQSALLPRPSLYLLLYYCVCV